MKKLQSLLSTLRRACEHYEMIHENDIVAVALSGGKDSVALLRGLCEMSRFYPVPFSVCAVTIDSGFDNTDYSPLRDLTTSLGVPYNIVKTEISEIVFNIRHEKNPCSLCSMLRRGALVGAALEMGASSLALGHHLEDAASTFMMSLIYDGRIGSFSPVAEYENGLRIIRPLVYTHESTIKSVITECSLPVVKSTCPANGKTKRADTSALLASMDFACRGVSSKIIGALERSGIDGWK